MSQDALPQEGLALSYLSVKHAQMLRMLEMQGTQPHNVQEQIQSSHPRNQDFQTRKIDQTQKIPEMSGMLGMQLAGHKTVVLLTFPKSAIKSKH